MITKYENQTLVNRAFRMEDCWFINCNLKNCTLFYSGGIIRLEKANHLENCNWRFEGAAQQTLSVLAMIGTWSSPTPSFQPPSVGPVN